MGLKTAVVIHLLWNIIRLTFLATRNTIWCITGIYTKLDQTYSPSSYKKTAHVMKILARHKFDPILQPAALDNFIAVHHSFEDPEYVLADHISLYYITKTEALFVEAEKGVDVSSSDHGAFLKKAQLDKAKNVITLPLHVFNQIGEKIGKTDAKIVFVHNTARCGSTLVSQGFEQTGSAVSYTEPDALYAITQLKGILPQEEIDQIRINVINYMCKPFKNKKINTFVFKHTPPTMRDAPEIVHLFPDIYNLFLYRDGLKCSQSFARIIRKTHLYIFIELGKTSEVFSKIVMAFMCLPSQRFDSTENRSLSPIHFGAIAWASTVRMYLDFRDAGMKIAAMRYEDIVENPKHAFKRMFEYCDLPEDFGAVERAMNRDSQRISPISREKLSKYKIDEFTPDVKKQTDRFVMHLMCHIFPNHVCLLGL